jgi:L-ascorbate metabolism protein UlaG (beta-lactamase superfamily)
MRFGEHPLPVPLPQLLAEPPGEAVRLLWLGQAGFVIDGDGRRVVIDPYLSDSLAGKYRGALYPHTRMMPVPVLPGEIRHVDMVLATHHHTDHLDPGTLPALLAANPGALLVAPEAARDLALERSGIAPARLVTIDAGRTFTARGIEITAVRAAHEELERDAAGHHLYLGYAVRIGGAVIFHSGDTVPFAGQAEEAARLKADLALLPVNGRDAERKANGVSGNMTIGEALALARQAGIGQMIAHHFDLFAFNTVPRAEVEAAARESSNPLLTAARADRLYLAYPRRRIEGNGRSFR